MVLEEDTKETLVNAISFLINKCFVTLLVTWFLNKILVYQLALTQPHFGSTSFFILLNLRVKKTNHFKCIFYSVDDLCTINDENEFLTSFKNVCAMELDLTVERQVNHASFLDLDIKVEDCFRI